MDEWFAGRWTPLETVVGWRFGHDPLTLPHVESSPRTVLEEHLREVLERTPCLVQFSGGRDSSALLALAIHVARRDGFDEPVAFTRRYPGITAADESAWQERVVRHLNVRDWERVEIHDELDAIGPIAGPLVQRFGPLWPPAAHSNVPAFERARGGSVITGEGGDNVFGPQRTSVLLRTMIRRQRLNRAALSALWSAHAPRPLRRRALERKARSSPRRQWLTPAAFEAFVDAHVRDELGQPLDWAASIGWQMGSKAWQDGYRFMERLASDYDVELAHLLSDIRFVGSLRPIAGRLGFRSRADIMLRLFGDLLPEAILRRVDKAYFNASLFREPSRRFAVEWDAAWTLRDLVDPDSLRSTWRSELPHAGLITPLQAAWREAPVDPNYEQPTSRQGRAARENQPR